MSVQLIRETTPIARKEYSCDACDALLASMAYPDEFDSEDLKILDKAHADGWLIKKGEQYTNQTCKYDDLYTFRAKTDVMKVYFKYDMNDI